MSVNPRYFFQNTLKLKSFVIKCSANSVDDKLLCRTTYLWPLNICLNFQLCNPHKSNYVWYNGRRVSIGISTITVFWRNRNVYLWICSRIDSYCCITNSFFPYYDCFLEYLFSDLLLLQLLLLCKRESRQQSDVGIQIYESQYPYSDTTDKCIPDRCITAKYAKYGVRFRLKESITLQVVPS